MGRNTWDTGPVWGSASGGGVALGCLHCGSDQRASGNPARVIGNGEEERKF